MKLKSLRERLSRAAAMLVCLAVLLSASVSPAFAYERIDTEAEASLTASFGEVEDASFRLYKIADVSDAVEFTLAGDFADAPISLDGMESASDWADLAVTLSAWAGANSVSPDKTGTTDADGCVSFSGLTVGLYLLVGNSVVVEDISYTPTPSIVMLPTLLDDDTWAYDSSADVKYTKTPLTEYQDITVKKVWNDGGSSRRPDSVKIQLLRNGKVAKTVTLDSDNNWTYTWGDLASTYVDSHGEKKAYAYSVSESSVPTGYTVSVSQNGGAFTVTNTHKSATTTRKDPTLPQTGTLNWPIPVLVALGLALFSLGWMLRFGKKRNGHEK